MSTPNPAPTLQPLTGTPAVAVVNKTLLSNGAIAVTLRPNNDPLGDSVHTFYVAPTTTAADVQAWLTDRQTEAANQYAALHAAHSAFGSI